MEHSYYSCLNLQNYCFRFPGSEELKQKLKLQSPDMTCPSRIVFLWQWRNWC